MLFGSFTLNMLNVGHCAVPTPEWSVIRFAQVVAKYKSNKTLTFRFELFDFGNLLKCHWHDVS